MDGFRTCIQRAAAFVVSAKAALISGVGAGLSCYEGRNGAGEGGEVSTQFEQVRYEDALGDSLEELRIVA